VSLESMMNQSVTVVTPGSTSDGHGNPQPNWASAGRATYKAWLEQTSAVEVTEGRDTVISDWLLVLPASAVINAYDRVEVGPGPTIYEVVGSPFVAPTPRGPHHIEARLRLLEG
jgi:hypothetical protein